MHQSPPNFYDSIPAIQTREVLRDNPELSYLSHLNYSEERYRGAIGEEIQQRWIELNKGKSPETITNEGGYRKIRKQVHAKYEQFHRQHRARTLLWLQSERILNLLRTKGQTPTPTQDQVDQAMLRFVQRLNLAAFPEIEEGTPHLAPNHYFELSRPQLVADWGYPFYSIVVEQVTQQDSKPTGEKIIGINSDWWAAFLGGDRRLGHDVVYFVPEARFYAFDVALGRYVPTTDDKMRLVTSQALQQRAYGQDANLASTLLNTFRTKKVMDEIISKAKAVLAADDDYFDGPDARPRWRGTRQQVQVDSTIATFVKEQVEPAGGHVLTVGECLLQLGKRGEIPLSRKVKTEKINEAIRDLFQKGLRNDLRLGDNRQVSGWKDLKLRDCETLQEDSSIRDTEHSVESVSGAEGEFEDLALMG